MLPQVFTWNVMTKKNWIWSVKRTAWLIAAVLLIIAFFSRNNSTGSILTGLTTLQKTMAPTMAYYDANQAAPAISAVSWVANSAGTGCTTGVQQTELFGWPGTTASTGQAATSAVYLSSWRQASFCLTYQAATATSQTTTGTCVAGGTFPDQCDACNCASTGACPVTNFLIASTAPAATTGYTKCTTADTSVAGIGADTATYDAYCQNNLWTTATASQTPLVNVTADVFGPSCVNPARHQSGSSYQYLSLISSGCTTFGADTYAKQADTMTQTDFFSTDTTNSAAMTTTRLFPAYTSTLGSGSMILQGRYRIQTQCSATCRAFRFGANGAQTISEYTSIYDALDYLMNVAFWLSVVTFALVIFVQFSGQRTWRTHENAGKVHLWYLYLAYWCILCTAVILFFLADLWTDISPFTWMNFGGKTGYETTQAQWAVAVTNACVTDPNWASVFTQLNAATTLTTFTWYLSVFTVVTFLLLIWLVLAVYWVWYVLNKRRAYSQIDHNDVELGYQD